MSNKILVVVDYQNDFVTGALGFKGADNIENGIAAEITKAAEDGDIIICTMDTHDENYNNTEEGRNLPVPHCIEDTYGWELYGKVGEAASKAGAIKITKPTFPSEELYHTLKEIRTQAETFSGKEITEIRLCGVVTNMCVISNAVVCKMSMPNAHIKILKDLCLSFDNDMHDKALEVMKSMQMEVV